MTKRTTTNHETVTLAAAQAFWAAEAARIAAELRQTVLAPTHKIKPGAEHAILTVCREATAAEEAAVRAADYARIAGDACRNDEPKALSKAQNEVEWALVEASSAADAAREAFSEACRICRRKRTPAANSAPYPDPRRLPGGGITETKPRP